jgi:hypothetical protein
VHQVVDIKTCPVEGSTKRFLTVGWVLGSIVTISVERRRAPVEPVSKDITLYVPAVLKVIADELIVAITPETEIARLTPVRAVGSSVDIKTCPDAVSIKRFL